ncbi:unnamed protein product, partial [Rotaria magnacalcarata]
MHQQSSPPSLDDAVEKIQSALHGHQTRLRFKTRA